MEYKVKHGNTYIPLNSSANKSVITAATQSRKLCGDDTVKITLQSAEYINFAIGDTIDVFGTTYTINQLPTVKRNGERDYEYTLVFEGLQYALIDRVFLMPDNTEGNNLMFDLAGMMAVLITNINRGNSGKPYVLGTCPADTEYKNLSLTEKNCLQVLQQLCQEWDTEFTIVEESNQITINIGAAGTVFGVPFTYGRNGGIYNLNREKGATDVITRLFCYGGTQNLTWYRHNRLCLPSKTKNQSYIESSAAQQTYGIKEAVKNFDEIYPNRIGEVSSVSGCEYNEFIDTSMADSQNGGFDLNAKWPNTTAGYTEWRTIKGLEDTTQNRNIYDNDVVGTTRYLINGETAKIHFNTGALAGYEIDIHSYNHTTQKFVLQPLIDENNYDFPSKTNSTFRIAAGDKYVILGINLPESYKTQAENELEDAAEDYFATVCTPQPKYSLEIEPLALQRIVAGLHSDGEREVFKVGDAVHITDTDTGVDADIRIDRFDRDLIDTWKYKLTLTDEVTYTSQVKTLIELNQIKRVVQESGIADPNKIRRGWKDAEELYNMVFDTEGQIYGEKIQPLSIDTTMLKVGARSQQLTLQNVTFQPNYLGNPAYFEASAGYLVHLSIDESGPKTWTMSALSASSLSTGGLYLYARCSRSGNTGTWVLSNQAITFDSESGWYNFLIGTLGSVDSNTNTRTFSPTYGFSTINGRYITTGRIQSADGQTYIDIDTGEIHGNVTFNASGQAALETLINNTVDTEISGLGIDGTNLLAIDQNKWEQGTWSTATGAHNTSDTRIRNTKGGNYIRVEAGTTYTISRHTDVGASNTYHVVLYAYDSSGNYVSADSKTEWQTTFPFTWTPTTATRLEVGIRHSDNSTIMVTEAGIAKIKIEKGDMATAWTLSPEDVQSGIDAISNMQIGGRNYLPCIINNGIRNNLNGASYDNGKYTLKSAGSTSAFAQLYIDGDVVNINNVAELAGKQVTFSARSITEPAVGANSRVYLYCYQGSAWTSVAYIDAATLSKTFIMPSSVTRIGLIIRIRQNSANNVANEVAVFDGIKLELGTVATDWSPAPEDLMANENLVYNSADMPFKPSGTKGWRGSGTGATITQGTMSNAPLPELKGCVRCTNANSAAQNDGIAQDNLSVNLKAGEYLTMSFWIRASAAMSNKDVTFQMFWVSGSNATIHKTISLTTSWQYVSATAAVTADYNGTASMGYVYVNNLATNAWFEVCGMKVERGSVATPWSPSPYDVPYDELIKNLTATCDTAAGTLTKVVVCPDLTPKMLVDTNLRIRIKFTNSINQSASQGTMLILKFKNTSSGADIVPSGASNAEVYWYYHGTNALNSGTSSYQYLPFWNEGQVVELTYKDNYVASSVTRARLMCVNESEFDTQSALFKAYSGKTSIYGGLILTQTVICGSGSNQAGVNGTTANDVAFWAGGNLGSAYNWLTAVVIKRDGDAKFGVLRFGKNGKISMPDGTASGVSRLEINNELLPNVTNSKLTRLPSNATATSTDYYRQQISSTSTTITGSGTSKTVSLYSNTISDAALHNGMFIWVKGSITVSQSNSAAALACSIKLTHGGSSSILVTGNISTGSSSITLTIPENSYMFDGSGSSVKLELIAYYNNSSISSITMTYSGSADLRWYHDTAIAKTNLCKDGLAVVVNLTNFFQVKETTVSGSNILGITAKSESVNMAGVLWCGIIKSGGTKDEKYKSSSLGSMSVSRGGTGVFVISFASNESNATLVAIATPIGTTSNYHCNTTTPTKTSLTVYALNGTSYANFDFNLVIFGTNL